MPEELKNKVLHGDCLEEMKKIPDGSIDMILCDLPYGTTACKWDTIIPFEPLWEQYKRIIKNNGAIVLTASQPFTSALVMSNIDNFKYSWVWEKSVAYGFVHAKNQPMKKHEDILVFSKAPMGHKSLLGEKRMRYSPEGIKDIGIKKVDVKPKTLGARPNQDGKEYMATTGYPTSIIKFKNDKGLHPTQKPVALFEYLIKTYTNEGDLVLDNCAGSGTTAIACINTKRDYILIEKEKEYIDIINKRIANLPQPLF